MDVTELRLGNLIHDLEDRSDPNIYVVARIEFSEYTSWNSGEDYNVTASCLDPEKKGYFDIKPHGIPITEERLVELGFEKAKYWEGGAIYLKNRTHLEIRLYKGEWLSKLYYGANVANYINIPFDGYTHSLQNIYFALSGQELTKKQ
jgi:hypothetical protein